MQTPALSLLQSQQQLDLFSSTTQILLVILAIISSLISLLFPLLYYIKHKCIQHPSSLIAIISLLQALSNYNIILIAINIYQFQHFVKINQIFDFLVFYRTGQPSQNQFCQINFMIYIVLELMAIAYNICFSADLLITLKKPFFAGHKRMKFYHLFCVVLLVFAIPLCIEQSQQICNDQFHSRSIYKIPLSFLFTIAFFFIVSLVIIIMSFISVQTSQIRKKYIRLHRIILVTLMVLWAFPIANNIIIMLGDQTSSLFHILNIGSFISLLLSGAIINIVRFYNDTYVWQQIKNMLKQWTKCQSKKNITPIEQQKQKQQEKKKQQQSDIWNLPLAHAVATFHHQSVVSNIIQIVLQTCTNTPQQLAIQKSQYQHNKTYNADSAILQMRQIKKMLRNGSKQDAKRLVKITKTQEMLCLQPKQKNNRRQNQKNIYKSEDYLATFGNQIDAVNWSGQDKMESVGLVKTINSTKKNDKAITIKVKSYADPVFLALRLLDNFTSEELSRSLDLTWNADNIKKARQSLGASGSFFFFSYDHRLVIKTITQKQCQVFLNMLPEYYQHILNNPNSLISRAYGLFSVQIAGLSKIYFIMMQNTLKAFQQNNITYKKYDLKGSTIKRQVKSINADVFKDINLLKSDDAFLIMSQQRKTKLLAQIKYDITLLSKQNIMDYSLLLGIGYYKKLKKNHNIVVHQSDLDAQQNEWRCFDDGHEITGKIYTLSLIDYLQQFDFNKIMQLKLKKLFKGGGDISSVDSKSYFDRFMKFVTRIIVVYRK